MDQKQKEEPKGSEGKRKIKILCHMDSTRCSTGFGNVAKGIFDNLVKTGRYQIDIFGVNDLGFLDPDPVKFPYRILPAMIPGVQGDFYGRLRFINILRGADPFLKPSWDIIFTLNDPFIFEEPVLTAEVGTMDALRDIASIYRKELPPEHWCKIISYWPIDSPLKENWLTHAIGLPDYSVAYTDYGKQEIEKANQKSQHPLKCNLETIYHGTDTTIFHPLPEAEVLDFKKKFFKKASIDITKTFIVGVVARNQMRKDLPRVMRVFKEFQKRRPDSMLYIHAKEQDVWGSLGEYARQLNLELGKDWIFPGNFNENTGYPAEYLNLIYNSMDVQLLCTQGEGWGLPITEAMAAKTLTLAPNITSIPELFDTVGNNIEDLAELEESQTIRGIPLKAGATLSEWVTMGPTDYERFRPLTNVEDATRKLIWVYDHPEQAAKIAERAYQWIQQYSWSVIAQKWDELFQRVYQQLEIERADFKPDPKTDKSVKPQLEATPQ